MVIPDVGQHLWIWYWEISNGLRRVSDGAVNPIPWSEFLAWAQVTGQIVRPSEYAILREMDAAFCAMTGQEIQDYYARKFPQKDGKG